MKIPITNKPGVRNWVQDAGGLPDYIKRIAEHLKGEGMSDAEAIASAVNTVKRWAAGGTVRANGGPKVKADTQAKAAKALAEWNRKKDLALPVPKRRIDLASIRRVKTPEGVKRFGKPIGSIIISGAGGGTQTTRIGAVLPVRDSTGASLQAKIVDVDEVNGFLIAEVTVNGVKKRVKIRPGAKTNTVANEVAVKKTAAPVAKTTAPVKKAAAGIPGLPASSKPPEQFKSDAPKPNVAPAPAVQTKVNKAPKTAKMTSASEDTDALVINARKALAAGEFSRALGIFRKLAKTANTDRARRHWQNLITQTQQRQKKGIKKR